MTFTTKYPQWASITLLDVNRHMANIGSNIRSLMLIYSPLLSPFHQPFIYIASSNTQEKQTS